MIIEILSFLPSLIIFPAIVLYIIRSNSQKIMEKDPEFYAKYSYLMDDVSETRIWYGKYNVPVMLIRRLLFIVLPIIFHKQFVL